MTCQTSLLTVTQTSVCVCVYVHVSMRLCVCLYVCLTTVSFIAPIITVIVAITHQLMRDADPRCTQEVVLPPTHSCQPKRERERRDDVIKPTAALL